MTFAQINDSLAQWAPPALAENYDNVGLLVGEPDTDVAGILVALEVTDAVMDEAAAAGANLVVTHHPIWFGGRKRLNGDDYASRAIIRALRDRTGLIAVHTNLDSVMTGVNRRIGERIGLKELRILRPAAPQTPEVGAGMLGDLPAALSQSEFLATLARAFGAQAIRYAPGPDGAPIRRVAFCGGAGAFLIPDALKAGADAFFTGDITYHKFFDADGRMLLADIGHYESEQFTTDLLYEWHKEKFPNIAVWRAQAVTNPTRFHIQA